MKFITTQEINRKIQEDADGFIKESEEKYNEQIKMIAQSVIDNKADEKPIILLSGPSGSGKTTTALRIERILKESGHSTRTISLDNYFLPKDAVNMPLDENGKPDLESPRRLDIELLRKHIDGMVKRKYIEIPVFDFRTQSRTSFIPFVREKDNIIIMEGIHALNPEVTGSSLNEHTTCVYVSVRTRIKANDGFILHPRKIRLMRRLIRDKRFRGRMPYEVFDMFKSVSKGEDLYIMPYKHRADFEVDTFLATEPSVYKGFVMDDLLELNSKEEYYEESGKIIRIMSEIQSIPTDNLSEVSLIREFIGGGSLV